MRSAEHGQAGLHVVYTWVDGAWPGYQQALSSYATRPEDLNPNRYRDNLDLLRFSLRSLWQFAPRPLRITIVTQRPQVPNWLVTDDALQVVHHDAFMPSDALPTFSSFAIVANLLSLPVVNGRFLYVEDDHLACRPFSERDLFDDSGRPIYWARARLTGAGQALPGEHIHPWNAALMVSNHWLNLKHGVKVRHELQHAPVVFDKQHADEFVSCYREALSQTSNLRFRTRGAVATEYLYPMHLYETGRAVLRRPWQSVRHTTYVGLDNHPRWLGLRLSLLAAKRPLWACLNDNFGSRPDERSVQVVKRFLGRMYPTPSPWEK